jgi:hypothetical protein
MSVDCKLDDDVDNVYLFNRRVSVQVKPENAWARALERILLPDLSV